MQTTTTTIVDHSRSGTSEKKSLSSPTVHQDYDDPTDHSSNGNGKICSSTKKRLHFGQQLEYITVIPNLDEYSMEERINLWYTKDDFSKFRTEADLNAKIVRKRYFKLVRSINASFTTADETAANISNDDNINDDLYLESSIEKLDLCQLGLEEWCAQADYRGLERLVSLTLRNCHDDVRDRMAHLVLVSKFLCPIETCRRSQHMSRTTRLFARMVGQADAASFTTTTSNGSYYQKTDKQRDITSSSCSRQLKQSISSTTTPRIRCGGISI